MVAGFAVVASVALVSATARAGGFTVELDYSPPEVAPGGTVDVSGTCLDGDVPTDFARIYAFIQTGQPGAPYDYADEYPVEPDGSFEGEFVLPSEAPPGDWTIQLSCRTQDAFLGQIDEGPLTVTGDPVTTTTTSGTSSTSTPTTIPPTPPAPPVEGTVTYTG